LRIVAERCEFLKAKRNNFLLQKKEKKKKQKAKSTALCCHYHAELALVEPIYNTQRNSQSNGSNNGSRPTNQPTVRIPRKDAIVAVPRPATTVSQRQDSHMHEY
jgi:hypothetical protein